MENEKPKKRNRFHTAIVVIIIIVFIIFLLLKEIIYIPFLPRNLSAYNIKSHEGKTVYILPLGEVDNESITYIRDFLASDMKIPVVVLDQIPIPKEAWGRPDQVDAYYLASMLKRTPVPKDTLRLVGLTSVDIYIKDWNFIFGLGEVTGQNLLISLYMMRPSDENDLFIQNLEGKYLQLYQTRLRKIFRHEIGHTFHLHHCPNPWCVMSFADRLSQQDSQGEYFCPICAFKLLFDN